MATVLVATYAVRYPMGGMLSYHLHLLVGLARLGHDVYLVERATGPDECWDPVARRMGDDASVGMRTVDSVLRDHGLGDRWAFVDRAGNRFGLSPGRLADLLRRADILLDVGAHGAWNDLVGAAHRVLLDGEPGWTQMRWAARGRRGEELPTWDAYATVGQNVGTDASPIPTLGIDWRPTYYPVVVDLIGEVDAPADAPFTTVMNWQAHEPLIFDGVEYGQKDREFARFGALPALTAAPLEVAVAGDAPRERLRALGWRVRDAHRVTASLPGYWRYIAASRGEFSVAKHVFVATRSGWFSERSALYLAHGRPVVVQDTGLAGHLPLGRGLFAVRDVDEAAAAVHEATSDYRRQSAWARELAREHFDASIVLPALLRGAGDREAAGVI